MIRLRGEELPGFLDVLQSWLPHQPWFPAHAARWTLTRTGGLRLPTPAGEPDPTLFLELHIFDVAHGGDRDRISVPLVVRSRPSALAGKDALVGMVHHRRLGDIWLYDGARDRAFLAAWLEMVRRSQGTRNGRARGEALNGFEGREAFTVRLRRSSWDTAALTRTLITPDGTDASEWGQRVVIDFLRRPARGPAPSSETLEALTRARVRTVPALLGRVTGAWENTGTDDAGPAGRSPSDEISWEHGELALIRGGSLAAPDGAAQFEQAGGHSAELIAQSRGIGRALGTFHGDLAAVFGSYPQKASRQEAFTERLLTDLDNAWSSLNSAPGRIEDEEHENLEDHVDTMRSRLDAAPAPLMIQTVHGQMGLQSFHRPGEDAEWVVAEAGEMQSHSLPLQDAVPVIRELTLAAEQHQSHDAAELVAGFLEGIRDSDAEVSWTASAAFVSAALATLMRLRSEDLISSTTLTSVCQVVDALPGSVP